MCRQDKYTKDRYIARNHSEVKSDQCDFIVDKNSEEAQEIIKSFEDEQPQQSISQSLTQIHKTESDFSSDETTTETCEKPQEKNRKIQSYLEDNASITEPVTLRSTNAKIDNLAKMVMDKLRLETQTKKNN